jgi:hypothetical protein
MGLLRDIRYGKTTIRVYSQMRTGATIGGPLFVLMGIVELFGFGATSFQGKVLTGVGRIVSDVLFVVIGLLLCYLRLTILRDRRSYDKSKS